MDPAAKHAFLSDEPPPYSAGAAPQKRPSPASSRPVQLIPEAQLNYGAHLGSGDASSPSFLHSLPRWATLTMAAVLILWFAWVTLNIFQS